ncbi:calcium-binding protein [Falsiroseomonas oryzae]|uniref:calcium-binding protein n=1 Tax=Falsiroseomonas oryzae TaxID=2766473 RepID=UPI0022EA1E52|nr:calcium-binding protein [Roseomonas sp. MO-31]
MSITFGFAGTTSLTSLSITSPLVTSGTTVSTTSLFAPLTLTGTAGDDNLVGNLGGDTFRMSGGWDRLDGSLGNDTVDYSTARGAVNVWLPDAETPDLGWPGFSMPYLPGYGTPTPTPIGPGEAEVLPYEGGAGTIVTTYEMATSPWLFEGKRDTLVSIENAIGSAFSDTLFGGDTDNLLRGGNGHDLMGGDDGRDTLRGEDGNDRLHGGRGADLLEGGIGDDLLVDHAMWTGKSPMWHAMAPADEPVVADADTLQGGAGADTLVSAGGGDLVQGGEGSDLLLMSFATGSAAVAFEAVAGSAWTVRLAGVVTATVDTVEQISIEGGSAADAMNAAGLGGRATLSGGAGRDTLTGGTQADVLVGGTDGDMLRGGGGADRLEGGLGRDTLHGGGARDIFIWNSVAEGGDRVLDFATRVDMLQVDASAFGGGLQAGGLAAGQLAFGTAATAATGQFVYDQATGRLGWDADGVGAGAARDIATFAAGTVLAHTDFLVVA